MCVQLRDASFRRQFLVQCAALLHCTHKPGKLVEKLGPAGGGAAVGHGFEGAEELSRKVCFFWGGGVKGQGNSREGGAYSWNAAGCLSVACTAMHSSVWVPGFATHCCLFAGGLPCHAWYAPTPNSQPLLEGGLHVKYSPLKNYTVFPSSGLLENPIAQFHIFKVASQVVG